MKGLLQSSWIQATKARPENPLSKVCQIFALCSWAMRGNVTER